jgi:hypothetical protein
VKRVAAVLTLAALAAALAALTACSGSSPIASEPPPLASLLATPSSTPTPPAAAVITGAVQAYIDGLNQGFLSGNVSAAIAASSPSCTCREQVDGIVSVYNKHEHFIGTHIVVLRIVPVKLSVGSGEARATLRMPASDIALANGKRQHIKARPPAMVQVTVVLENGHWVVGAVKELPHPSKSASPLPSP